MTRSVLTAVVLLIARPAMAADPPVVSRIAFGSCAKQDKPQPIWDAVVETKPQHFVFLGDNTGANGVVFLTGDRHLAEVAKLPADHKDGVGYPLFDVTSSSLNAPSGNVTTSGVRFASEVNAYRVGLTYFEVNFGTVLVDWEPADPVVRLQVRGEKGEVVLQQRVALSQLRAKP